MDSQFTTAKARRYQYGLIAIPPQNTMESQAGAATGLRKGRMGSPQHAVRQGLGPRLEHLYPAYGHRRETEEYEGMNPEW